jgi:hypothetical protein
MPKSIFKNIPSQISSLMSLILLQQVYQKCQLLVTNSGYYGFPVHPTEKCLKIGHHGTGFPLPAQVIDKESLDKKLKSLLQNEEMKFRIFLKEYNKFQVTLIF